MNYHDLIWGELNRQAIDAMKESANGQFDSYIKNREDMVMFLLSERKNYQQALTLLCDLMFLNLLFLICSVSSNMMPAAIKASQGQSSW